MLFLTTSLSSGGLSNAEHEDPHRRVQDASIVKLTGRRLSPDDTKE